MKQIERQEKCFRTSSITITEDETSVKVIYRCKSIKEGWWLKEFRKTNRQRKEALKLFSSVNQ